MTIVKQVEETWRMDKLSKCKWGLGFVGFGHEMVGIARAVAVGGEGGGRGGDRWAADGAKTIL